MTLKILLGAAVMAAAAVAVGLALPRPPENLAAGKPRMESLTPGRG